MNRLEKYEREHLENVGFDKAELYNKHSEKIDKEVEIYICEDILVSYIGYKKFKKLSSKNVNMIIGAMLEYSETFRKGKI